ncbi:MAG: phospho-N-acetylmuramoyl-pentapeptide-transferase, partial [bacterium]|nr:phospho-N-acetylmuramoyl-pentapeptide-transferase [bacterium]
MRLFSGCGHRAVPRCIDRVPRRGVVLPMLILLLDLIKFYLTRTGGGDLGPFRVLTYNSVRASLALLLAFAIALAVGPWIIRRLALLKAGQVIRKAYSAGAIDLSAMHGKKAGTPTMGGLLMLIALLPPVLLFCRLTSLYTILLLAMTLGYGALGFWDDYLKIIKQNHKGVSPRGKLLIQGLLGLVLGLTLWGADWPVYYAPTASAGYPHLLVPFFKFIYPSLGLFYVPFVMLVLLATSTAVNVTDGLDGLAIGVSIANLAAFIIIGYLVSRDFANYLYVPFIHGGEEIPIFLAALLGASLGFLWFNAHPAQIFMGDTGSMMLGGAIGTAAILLKQEILLVVIGGIFVIESLSVMLQVFMFKLTG